LAHQSSGQKSGIVAQQNGRTAVAAASAVVPLTILAISGSLRSGSYNTALLRAVKERAPASLAIDIVTPKGIPLYDADEEKARGIPVVVNEIAERIRAAQGLIIATPEYNFAIPGGLKNLTDWVSRVKQQPFKHKPVGVMGASGGRVGTARSQYQLRQNLLGVEAIAMPKPEIFVASSAEKFDEAGRLTDQKTMETIGKWLTAYEAWVRKLS
jgi:chromate reductase, NAD(P)H dehydrogenase (quinone)